MISKEEILSRTNSDWTCSNITSAATCVPVCGSAILCTTIPDRPAMSTTTAKRDITGSKTSAATNTAGLLFLCGKTQRVGLQQQPGFCQNSGNHRPGNEFRFEGRESDPRPGQYAPNRHRNNPPKLNLNRSPIWISLFRPANSQSGKIGYNRRSIMPLSNPFVA